MEGFFEKGILHGFVRKYDSKQRLSSFGFYQNGRPAWIWWELIEGGGSLVGFIDESTGELTGPEVVYIYPDFKTGLMGFFREGQLKSAQTVRLECVLNENNIFVPLFTDPEGPMFKKEVSDTENMTSDPLLSDPYEDEMVEVRQSSVPFANEGLFMKQTVESDTILAFYNGIRREPKKSFDKPNWTISAYRIFDPTRKKGSLDIPSEYIKTSNYCATLAHKTNHSFMASAEFEVYNHPRFGHIPCLMSITKIKAGEEVFVHYGYDLDRCPEWYAEAWDQDKYPVPESWQSQLNGDN